MKCVVMYWNSIGVSMFMCLIVTGEVMFDLELYFMKFELI